MIGFRRKIQQSKTKGQYEELNRFGGYHPAARSLQPFRGGASTSKLNNCTVTGNSAPTGGGGYKSTLDNSIVAFNTAASGTNYDSSSTLSYCSTTPLPASGIGNITNEALFVDYTNGNLRVQSNSPSINAGNNGYLVFYDDSNGLWFTNRVDMDGNPRRVSGTVDLGAYEYQWAGSVISYAWLQQYGLPTDGSADYADPDHDGVSNWQEWVCRTDPTNAQSVLRMVSTSTYCDKCDGDLAERRWSELLLGT